MNQIRSGETAMVTPVILRYFYERSDPRQSVSVDAILLAVISAKLQDGRYEPSKPRLVRILGFLRDAGYLTHYVVKNRREWGLSEEVIERKESGRPIFEHIGSLCKADTAGMKTIKGGRYV